MLRGTGSRPPGLRGLVPLPSPRGPGAGLRCLLLCALALAAPASAVQTETAPARFDEIGKPFRVRIDQVLDRAPVGDGTLRDALATLRFEGCLASIEDELVTGLDALRVVQVRCKYELGHDPPEVEYATAVYVLGPGDAVLDQLETFSAEE